MANPHTTILVVKHNGKEVGRMPATAPNANEHLADLARHYLAESEHPGEITVDYEPDPTGGFLVLLHQR